MRRAVTAAPLVMKFGGELLEDPSRLLGVIAAIARISGGGGPTLAGATGEGSGPTVSGVRVRPGATAQFVAGRH